MAQLSIVFTPANPAPANGYRVRYRKKGTTGAYTTYPSNPTSSPAILTGLQDGFDYEGYIESACADGAYSSQRSWSTNNHS